MAKKAQHNLPVTGKEASHVQILRSILENQTRVSGAQLSRMEKRHRSVGGNAIRAAVLGGNDGLVSNFSLVMGISMALGEWISVKSSQELYENQMQLEMDELENNPAGELRELKLIYIAKGIPAEQAAEMAEEIMKDKEHAHEVLVREELGINTEELKGSAMEAAVSSFVLFAIGAVIPVLPFMFTSGMTAIIMSVAGSAAGLF